MPTCRKASCDDAGILVNGTPREAEERDGVSRKEGGERSKWRNCASRKARQME